MKKRKSAKGSATCKLIGAYDKMIYIRANSKRWQWERMTKDGSVK